ncbi:TonB-dependent receptor plug domain-containing protein, partial [Myxococcota bacterium]
VSGLAEQVEVIEGREPHRGCVLSASRHWRFEPATRDGRPVAARMRLLVQVDESQVFERATLGKPPNTGRIHQRQPRTHRSTVPEPKRRRQVAPAPLEVVVQGEKSRASMTSLTSAESRQIPGTFGDPMRAVEVMPGVTPVISGVPYFFVRGAPPGNVGYFIDGVRVPQLYHVFVGPSVIHPGLIERIELHRGGYPAQYGRYSGAVVAAQTSRPRGELRGTGLLRLFDVGALVEAPLAGGQGSVMVAGRYSYTGLLLSLLTNSKLNYWDYQSLISYDLGRRDSVSLFAFGALDSLQSPPEQEHTGAEFHRMDWRWDSRPSRRTDTRLALTLGSDRTESEHGFVSDRSVMVRGHVEHRAPTATLRIGSESAWDSYELNVQRSTLSYAELKELLPSRNDLGLGVYADLVLNPESWITVTPGLRVDLFVSKGRSAVGVDPRVSAVFSLGRQVRLVHAVGIVHQTPNFVPAVPGAQVGNLRGGLQRSVQTSSGVEVDLPQRVTLSGTVFGNAFFNLSDPIGTSAEFDVDLATADVRGLGASVGLELALRAPLTRRVGGFLYYTLSRTRRSHGRISSLSAYDRPHVLNAALGYDFGRHWRGGIRTLLMSGVPGRLLTEDGLSFKSDLRARAFHRVDLRLEKRWVLTPSAWWGLVAEVLNATQTKEIIRRTCGETTCVDAETGPIVLPSFGVEGAF